MRSVEIGGRPASVIGLGAWQFGSESWGWNTEFGPADARAIVRRALELGITLFDTAEIYGRGASERILGGALGEDRERVVLASKVWPARVLAGQVRSAARRSLDRLGTGYLDLYQVHWPNPVTPLSWVMRGMRELAGDGLVRAVGVSNFNEGRWRRAERSLGSPVISNQVRFNLLQQGPLPALVPYAQAHDRVIIAYSPLAQGLLAGTYGPDNRPGGYRRFNRLFHAENLRRARPVLDVVREIAGNHGATPAQVALAWVISHPNVVAIPGAKSVAQVEANAAAAELALRDDERAALEQAAAAFQPIGRLRAIIRR